MELTSKRTGLRARACALSVAVAIAAAPLASCSREQPPPPVDDTRNGRVTPEYKGATPAERIEETSEQPREQDRAGLSGKQKVVMLAGAAALYYLYKKHKSAESAAGPEGQYYLSKNGRVYYRDAEHRAHWVTPPPGGIAVPESEAAQFRQFQGYDNRTTGRDLTGLAEAEAH